MKDKIEIFLNNLRRLLDKKVGKPALQRDLENPEHLAEVVSHSIGSDTQPIKFTQPTKQ